MSFYEQAADKTEYTYFTHRKTTITPPHIHAAVELLFIESGSEVITVNGKKITLCEGDACFFDSFHVHSYEKAMDATAYIILCPREYCENFISASGGKSLPITFKYNNYPLLANLYSIYSQKYKDEKNKNTAFIGALNILLSDIAENVELIFSTESKHESLMCSLLSYAEKNYSADLSLSFLADKFGYSKEHLSRLLRKYLGESWNSFVNRMRVKKAKQLLDGKNLFVTDVAVACGFANVNTFYTAYKKEFSTLPRKK